MYFPHIFFKIYYEYFFFTDHYLQVTMFSCKYYGIDALLSLSQCFKMLYMT